MAQKITQMRPQLQRTVRNISRTNVVGGGGNVRRRYSIFDVNGNVRAETSGGDVMVKVKNGTQGVHAETLGGDIDITVAKDIAANIDASTSGGSLICDLPVTVSGIY